MLRILKARTIYDTAMLRILQARTIYNTAKP